METRPQLRYGVGVLSALLALAGPGAVTAQSTPAAVFDRLAGSWTGHGELMGRSASFAMTWRVVSPGYAVLVFANGFRDAEGRRTPVLDAVALYRTAHSMPEATWFDSRGERITIEWQADDSTLTAHWRGATEQGRTEYRITADNGLRVRDHVGTADGMRLFAQATYTRRADTASHAGPLTGLAWLAGCWRREAGERTIDEQWMSPQGDAMLGMSRTVRGGTLTEFEYLRIEVIDGRVMYIAHPVRQAETAFPLLRAGTDEVVFENPAHDFPQRIGYRRIGPDSLQAWIEGEANGQTRRVPFPYARVRCP